jgi:predicted Zn-dependent protease
LEDGDSSVRVLAATVMAQQHNAHTKRIGALQVAASAEPARSDGWGELGQACLDYAESGLLEASRAETEANRGRAHLARSHTTRAELLDSVIP